MTAISPGNKKSMLVQIMNEVDEFSPEDMADILYWLRAKKAEASAKIINDTILPNNLTLEDIYAERDAMRREKTQ